MKEELENLKRENYRKQMLATRLLIQRNNDRRLLDKIKFTLQNSLARIGASASPNFNIFEAINVITQRAAVTYDKYHKLIVQNKELVRENNFLHAEVSYLTRDNQEETSLIDETWVNASMLGTNKLKDFDESLVPIPASNVALGVLKKAALGKKKKKKTPFHS